MANWLQSFRIRLTLLFGGLSLLIGGAMTVYVNQVASSRMTETSGESLRWVARSIAYSLAENLRERDREIALLAQSPALVKNQLTTAELRQRLEGVKRAYRYHAWIGFADAQGVVQAAAGGLLEGDDVSKRPWFIYGRQGAFVGDVHEAVMLAKKLANPNPQELLRFVDFASPVLDQDGKLQGVLASHALWSWVEEAIEGALRSDASRGEVEAMVVSPQGEILFPYQAVGTPLPANLPTDDKFGMVDWTAGARYLTSTVQVRASTSTDLKWRVVLRQPIDKALAPIAELHRTLLFLGLLGTAIFMFLVYRLAVSISRPIETMADTAALIEQGHEGAEFPAPAKTREIRRLGQALQGMARTLLDRRRDLEQINANLERTVAERTAELSSLYNEAPVGYHTVGPDGTILQINDAELTWLGYAREEVVGIKNIHDLLPPAGEAVLQERQSQMKAGMPTTPIDTHLVRRDGVLLPVRISSNAVLDAQGNLIFSRSAVMDVAELRRAEEQLRQVMEISPLGKFTTDVVGNCTYTNPALRRITGLSIEEAQGFGLRHGIHPDDLHQIMELRDAVLATPCTRTSEHRLVHPDGSIVWVRVNVTALWHNGEAELVVGTMEDITERRLLELELAEKSLALARSNEDLERFAYVASHDLQEPLRMVNSYGQLLQRRHSGALNDEAKEFLEFIVDGGHRAQTLVKDLLSLARLDSKAKPFVPVSLDAVLANSLHALRDVVKNTNAEVTHGELPTVLGDAGQLNQLFTNLISNALKFKGTDVPKVHVSASQGEEGWVISVKDNGIGIEPRFFDRIFVIFQRLHLRSEHPGTGIGLAICKRVVERHGGRIWVVSEPGHGAEFFFSFPVHGAEENTPVSSMPANQKAKT